MTETGWRNRIVGYDNVPPEQLRINEMNWRVHPKFQAEALSGALDDVGWVQDIIINKRTGEGWPAERRGIETVVDGHLRIELAVARGEPTVPVKYVDLDEREEMLVLATFDPLSAMAGTNKEALESVLRGVQTDQARVSELIASIAATAGIDWSGDIPEAPEPQIDRAEELREKWGVQRGQIWEIPSKTVAGKCHKIMCGDSTSQENVAKLMGGEKAALCVTDPPYGVDYDPSWRGDELDQTVHGKAIEGDKGFAWLAAFEIVSANVLYVWLASNWLATVQMGIEKCGFET